MPEFKLDDISEVASRINALTAEGERDLILIAGLPGVGKTTLAREFVRQTGATHFEIDAIKKQVVPEDEVADTIDPPEYRFKYYAEAIRKLPDLFARSSNQIVVLDETFHLRAFRRMWQEAAEELNIRTHWIDVACDEEIVKERLQVGKDRESHILGDKAFPMYLLFKEVFDPLDEADRVVDNSQDIAPQVQRIVLERNLTRPKQS